MSDKRPLSIDDLLSFYRAGLPRVSPDGKWVVFVATRPDRAADRNQSDLFRVAVDGGEVVQLTHQGSSNTDPQFSRDGRHLAFTSNRSGKSQVWLLPTDGGEARQVTRLERGVQRPVWAPDGDHLFAISPVPIDPDATDAPPASVDADGGGDGDGDSDAVKPRLIDELMFRHWDSWTDGLVDHLHRVDVATGDAVDVTPGPYPTPPRSLTGDPDYAVSPDGTEVCFVSLRHPDQARSTNTNLWLIPATGDGTAEPRRISPRDGSNAHPAYSPDGSRIAYVGMRRPGYEADRRELLVYDRASGETVEVAPGFDRSVGPPVWSPDGETLFFAAEDKGASRLHRVPAAGGKPEPLTEAATDRDPVVAPDGRSLVFVRQTSTAPPEICRVATTGGVTDPLTGLNRETVAALDLASADDFWYEGAGGTRIHGFMIKPPGFDAGTRYPVVFLIHGGPQGAFGFDFHERWNAHLFASPGYVVVMINPRGSTGYGQDFTDSIHGEWGGACYEDLARGFDHVLATYPFCDPDRTAACGASFGGFMVKDRKSVV